MDHTTHAWFPSSPCGVGCVSAPEATLHPVAQIARAARVVATVAGAVIVGLTVAPCPRMVRRRVIRRVARSVLAALGIRVQVRDLRPFAGRGVGLIVANHTSFLDILAIATHTPACFVAKAELLDWPVIGTFARRMGVIGIRRDALRELPATLATMVDGLHRDDAVGVFPEGTTWCGRIGGTFRPATFQAAIDAAVPVVPMHVGYGHGSGHTTTLASYIGKDGMLDTLRRVVATRGLTVTVRIHEVQLPGTDRRELARRCERLVFGPAPTPDVPVEVCDHRVPAAA